jgi:hypothetical protein
MVEVASMKGLMQGTPPACVARIADGVRRGVQPSLGDAGAHTLVQVRKSSTEIAALGTRTHA